MTCAAIAVAVIPSRFGSTRLPGKPLIDLRGMTMIERVYRRATRAKTLSRTIVATDDERIRDVIAPIGEVNARIQRPRATDFLHSVAAALQSQAVRHSDGSISR